jgi:tRNA (guanine-N7-)-methyltransferase
MADAYLNPEKRGFFGRRFGRPLSPARQNAFDTLMPKLGIPDDLLSEDGSLTPSSLFPERSYDKAVLEIGFGSGEHLKTQIERNPNDVFIGAEPFVNGMTHFLKDVEGDEDTQSRCRVYMDDARVLARSLAPQSIDKLYILNPDPWHKVKHHKRRIVRPETLDEFATILKPGADLIMSTDVPYLADWMFTHTFNHPAFEWTAKTSSDWQVPPKNWVTTRYEVKGAKGAKTMSYLLFKRE